MKDYSQEQYVEDFGEEKAKIALEHALDIRKFEIDLYWKRATYFWAFIGTTFAGYITVQAWTVPNKDELSVVLACLGTVFSFGWHCVNRGSKQWQENWENHVDMLEDEVTGPLYKVILSRPKPKGIKETISWLITGPSTFSVSKINQIISLYVTLLWCFLVWKSLPEFRIDTAINWEYVIVIGVSFLVCGSFFFLGRTFGSSYKHRAKKREAKIDNSA